MTRLLLTAALLATGSFVLFLPASPKEATARDYDVRDFCAVGDGMTLDTKAIRAAIDKCADDGGGRVVLAGGRVYLSGGLVLRSNVTLHIDAGSVLRGSLDKDDYPEITPQLPYLYTPRFTRQLIYAERETNIGITGQGTIDGQGTGVRRRSDRRHYDPVLAAGQPRRDRHR